MLKPELQIKLKNKHFLKPWAKEEVTRKQQNIFNGIVIKYNISKFEGCSRNDAHREIYSFEMPILQIKT